MTDRVSIDKQISALNTLINAVQRGEKFKPSEVKYMLPRWLAASDSLSWLSANEKKIKEALRDGQSGADKRA